MSQSRVYIDTSAYLGVLLGEAKATFLVPILKRKILLSSTLLLAESERNIVKLSRDGLLSQNDYDQVSKRLHYDKDLFILRDVTPDLCLTGLFPPVRTPRSSDLIHLRTALWFMHNGGVDTFVSLDKNQLEAAIDFGFQVAVA